MDWKVLTTAFVTLFLAEIGDKTQLAVIAMTAGTKKPLAVASGAILALTVVTILGVAAGQALTAVVPPGVMAKVAAAAFVVTGIVMWFWGGPE